MLYAIGYLVILIITSVVAAIIMKLENSWSILDNADYMFAVFIGLVWPITVPFFIIVFIVKKIYEGLLE